MGSRLLAWPVRQTAGRRQPADLSSRRRARRRHNKRQADPAFVPLTIDERFAGLALRLQRIEFLLEPFLGGFAGVDRAANPCVPPSAAAPADLVIGWPRRGPKHPLAWSGQRTAGPTNAPR